MNASTATSSETQALMAPWAGPHGGLPPLAGVNPTALEEAMRSAIEAKRAEVQAISSNPAPPSFENTAAALEDSGRALG